MKKQLSLIMLGILLISMMSFVGNVAQGFTFSVLNYKTAIIKAANRLVTLQSSTDYGWDWDVTPLTSHSASASATNIYGVTALGLIYAYQKTGNSAYLAAAQNTADFMKYGNAANGDFWKGHDSYYWGFSFDYKFLVEFSAVSGDPSYAAYASQAWAWQKTNISYYVEGLQAEAYNHFVTNGGGSDGYGAWQSSDYGLAAYEMSDTAWAQGMASVISSKIGDIASAITYKDMGMAWALKLLVTVDPVTYASEISTLKTNLKNDQLPDDGYWHDGNPDGDAQTTAYAVMGLLTAGEYTAARNGTEWLVPHQQSNGGWSASPTEYSETDSEAMQALAASIVELTVTSAYDSPNPPSGTTSYVVGDTVTASVTSPVSGVSGVRYVATGCTGTGSAPSSSGTTVTFTINQTSSIMWNWKTQYQVTFNQTGVGSDFTGTVVTVDSSNYAVSGLPVSFWWDQGSSHSFSFASPLNVGTDEQYFWFSTAGPSTAQSDTLTITVPDNVTATYLNVRTLTITATAGGTTSPTPGTRTYINGPVVTVTASPNTGYYLDNWVLDNVSVGAANPIQVLMDAPHQLKAVFGLSSGGYTLNITATPGGTTSPAVGNHNYPSGTVVTVTASPSNSYYFDHWVLDGNNNGTANTTQVTMNTNHQLTAVFTPPNYTLTITTTTNGATNPSTGNYTYPYGTLANVTALPNTGYVLDHWLLDGNNNGTANPTQVTMNTNHQLQAIFTLGWTLSITVTGAGTTNPSQGTHTYTDGTLANVTALPTTGSYFDHWELDGNNNGTANTTQVLMNINHQLTAVFTPLSYTLTITTTTGGNTNPAVGSYTYPYGTLASVTASPSIGYIFDHWVLDNVNAGTTNPTQVTINTNHQLTAVFTPPNYTLTITASAGGTTSPTAGNHTYSNGTIATVAASPVGGHTFDHWVLDNVNAGTTNPISIVMTADHQLTTIFTSPSFTLAIAVTTEGNTTANGGNTTPAPGNYTSSYGTILAITAWPSTGYFLEYWLLDGNNAGSDNPIQVTMNTNHQLTAVFATLNYQNFTLTITATTGGNTSPLPGNYTSSYGTILAATASPSTGYIFDHWVLDGNNAGTANPIQVTMNTNHQLKAIFTPLNYTLTITATAGGATDPFPGNYTYSYGTVANVTASPSIGYTFDHWLLDNVNAGTTYPTQVLMNANHQLKAFFTLLNYTLTITTTTNGTTSPTAGNYTYTYGTLVTVMAQPSTGYGLDHWLLDNVNAGASNPISIVMNTNHQLRAVFALLNFTLAIMATTGGNTNPAVGNYTYSYGTVATVTASPSANYIFDHWVLDGNNAGTANSTQVLMNTNHQLKAMFTPLNYTLTITATTGGATSPSPGNYIYPYGTLANVTALPNTGYGLDRWLLDNISVGTNNPIQVLINANHQLKAVFIPGYTLAITVTAGGTTNPTAGNYTYSSGTVVTVNASSSVGYYFDHWLLDNVSAGTANPIQVTMNTNHQLKAMFTPLNYTLTITAAAGGTTSPAAGAWNYSYGTVVTVTALPNAGYGLDRWLLDNVSSGAANPISITMNANHQLKAVFALFSGNYTLTITTTAGGATSPAAGIYTYSSGTVVTVIASPYTGYRFNHWELDGNNVGAISLTQVPMNANHQLKAFFASPLQAPAVWITPETLYFDTSHNHVGDRFNVTVWINTTGPSYSWQVQVDFNASQINVVRADYTGVGKSLFFAGHGTISVLPLIDNTTGFVVQGESLVGIDQVAAGSTSLFWIEFTIMAAPTGNETLTSLISVDSNPDKTFILDSDSNSVPNVGMGSATYSLSSPPPVRDVAVTNLSSSNYSPKQGNNVTISVVVLNNGTIPETFDVTIMLDSTPIATLNVAQLQPGNSMTLTFEWNTTAGAVGRHTMTASATVVPFDIDPTNNSKSKTVTIISPTAPNTDINGDGKVDMIDIAIVARAFGTHEGDARWNPAADLFPDGVINMIDVAMVARDFGRIM